jgi:hypothetical protein
MYKFHFIISLLIFSSSALALDLPNVDDHQHLGVATCASSVCHGSVQPYESSRIQQNEFITWQTDRFGNMHAKAYAKLLTDEGQSISAKLGWGPAEEAKECLQCHSDYVPHEQRGEEFQLDDGIGCEACHGGAGDYMETHTDKSRSQANKAEDGLFPTWQTQDRAKLCLSCHLGDSERMITHQIMGAGHPRLSFELDTFTFLQPHHRVDEDYVDRKGSVDNARDWAIGQALAASQMLSLLQDSEHGWRGVFIEPVLLDCHSCHKPMDADSWQARSGTGLGPGEMRLNDSNLIMLRLITMAVDSDLSGRIKNQTVLLHQATTKDKAALMQAAATLQTTIDNALPQFSRHDFSVADLKKVFSQLQIEADSGEILDYSAAEQAAMATVNLITAYENTGVIPKASMESSIDGLFATVAHEYDYDAGKFSAAMRDLLQQMPD